jgi:hypothetical protein
MRISECGLRNPEHFVFSVGGHRLLAVASRMTRHAAFIPPSQSSSVKMAPAQQQYIPGVCNIGHAEVRLRKAIGWVGLVITTALWIALAAVGASAAWRLLLFVPAAVAAVGFLQAAWHFCANFGLRGVLNFGPNVGKTDSVEQAEFRRQDRRKALEIIGLSMLAGAAVAAIAYFTA